MPLHSPLARSPFWQMARGDLKSEQAERGGMSIMASWFVSCYLPSAMTRAFHALSPMQKHCGLKCKRKTQTWVGGCGDRSHLDSSWEATEICFFYWSLSGCTVRMCMHVRPIGMSVHRAVRCASSWWQKVIITVTNMSVSVSYFPPWSSSHECCFFLSTSVWPFFFSFFFLRMGLRSQFRDDRGDLSVVSVLRRSVCFFFAAPSLFDILSKPFSFWLLQFQLSTSQYQYQINFVFIHSCLQWLFCV